MKRHKALHTLSHEHHHGLLLAQLIKYGSPDYKDLPKTLSGKKDYTLRIFKRELIPHFKKEEEILFPLSKDKSDRIKALINELIKQHKKVYSLIEKIEVTDSVEEYLNELGMLLESHIRLEERELFQEIQKYLTEAELNKLEVDLGSSSADCKI
jgi:iron-sulfur cluster repair protein YtfE (RIC family)